MKNRYVKTFLLTAMLTAAFFHAAFCQEETATVRGTDSFYTRAVLQADPWHNPVSPDTLLQRFALPSVSQLRESQPATTYLQYYLVGRLGQVARAYKMDSVTGKALIVSAFGYSFDSVTRWGASYGDDYLLTLLAPKWCTRSVTEYFLADRIRYYCHEKYYETARQLWKEYQSNFPNGEYRDSCRNAVVALEKSIAANSRNTGIVFRDLKEMPSLADILAPYKGKVVYLDIWGTWCGPCREEMKAVPALKKYFNGKDIVFLYLDMDGPEATEKWINYVRLEAITGVHCRLSQEQMEGIWQNLLPGKNIGRNYPSYFIFDRTGKLIVANARRPKDKDGLYAQLETALKKF